MSVYQNRFLLANTVQMLKLKESVPRLVPTWDSFLASGRIKVITLTATVGADGDVDMTPSEDLDEFIILPLHLQIEFGDAGGDNIEELYVKVDGKRHRLVGGLPSTTLWYGFAFEPQIWNTVDKDMIVLGFKAAFTDDTTATGSLLCMVWDKK